ncbi:depupylase/deamidase Dop [Intrasporangium sp. YIM S08009]|uniref:depupylase/deamidase Dop n=1 Tax=Intrasporangium zincisolvens TaxID=3080018 RepID=UPI002B053CFC|nr:depupylase/deamidase Dop [Intrasporangium sp. YIM S08009]
MTVRRIMGLETEYGISVPGDPLANPMFLSGQVVSVYAAAQGIRSNQSSWDYAFEDPLRDARGWQLDRQTADPSQLTDIEDPTLANVVLTNGARYYVDHAHPEYSSPEVTLPRDAVTWDRAGDAVALESVRLLASRPGQAPVNLYKNNADGKGQSYGTHENYLMPRRTPFADIVRHLIPFFVTRQVICGAGRVGLGVDSRGAGYQISQRADFFETEVGLETTLKRPIINTRDEPHAVADRYRRLHVIIGDATHLDVSTLLKVGTTSLVLGMIEDGHLAADWSVRRPVAALQAVSHDPGLTERVELVDGRTMTALDVQWMYLEAARKWLDARGDDPVPEATTEVMTLWEDVLTRLGSDVWSAARMVDWVAKLRLLEGYRSRDGLAWDDHRLAAIDIQWADVRPEKGLVHRLRDRGSTLELVTPEQVRAARTMPPEDTRAWFRGECVRRFTPHVFSASWDSVVFDVPGHASLQRVPILDPERGTRAQVGGLLEESEDVAALLRGLATPE